MAGTEGSPAEKAGFIIGPAKEEPIKSIRWRLWLSSPTPPARAATSRSPRPATISSSRRQHHHERGRRAPTLAHGCPRCGAGAGKPHAAVRRSARRRIAAETGLMCGPRLIAPREPAARLVDGDHYREVAGRLRELARPLRRVLERFASDSPLEEGEFELRSLSGPIYASGPDPNLADGSHWIRRWSKRDSNPQSPATRRGQAPRRQIFRKRHGATG